MPRALGVGCSFARDYHEHASIDMTPSDPLGPVEIVHRMRKGDRLAKLVWHRYVDRVARGLSVVVNTLDPDIVVLGGGMTVDESLMICHRGWPRKHSHRASTPP